MIFLIRIACVHFPLNVVVCISYKSNQIFKYIKSAYENIKYN